MLIQLCLNEPDIHEVKHNGNQAMSLLQTDAMNMKWVTSHCKKIVYITNLDKPLNVASQYLKAAILSKFKFTFIKLLDSKMYPPSGAIKTKNLFKRYYGMGGIVKYDKVINIQGRQWFFCYA